MTPSQHHRLLLRKKKCKYQGYMARTGRRRPELVGWPPNVERWLNGLRCDATDKDFVLTWMTAVARAVAARHPRRLASRTMASQFDVFRRGYRLLDAARGSATLRAFVAGLSDPDRLTALLTAVLERWIRGRPAGGTTAAQCRPILKVLRLILQGGGRQGVVPGVSQNNADYHVQRILPRLDVPGAAGGATEPRTPTKGPITDAEVSQLLTTGCRTPSETALITLLSTHAPRVSAICGMTVADVWDADAADVREQITVLEKGSQYRTLYPRKALRRALQTLCTGRTGPYLFGRNGRSQPMSCRGLRAVVERICRRAGVRPLHPHLFRSYVVNDGVRRGATLEQMARYVGHADVSTTGTHYYTQCPGDVVLGILDGRCDDPDADKSVLRARLVAAQTELADLCAQAAVRALAAAAPVAADGGAPPGAADALFGALCAE